MQTGSAGVWKVVRKRRLEVPVEHHHFITVPRINRIARSKLTLNFRTIKIFAVFIWYVEASYEIYKNLHHSKFSRYTVCSASHKTTRKLIALGFHKEKEVCQHSHFSDLVLVHTIHAICCNILLYAIYWYVEVSVLNCIALRRIVILLHIDISRQL